MEKRQLKAAESEQVGPGRRRPSGCNPGFRHVAQVPTGPRERPLSVWEGLTCTMTQFDQEAHPSRTQGQTRPPEWEARGGGPGLVLGGRGRFLARVLRRVSGTWGSSGVFRSVQGVCVRSHFPRRARTTHPPPSWPALPTLGSHLPARVWAWRSPSHRRGGGNRPAEQATRAPAQSRFPLGREETRGGARAWGRLGTRWVSGRQVALSAAATA